jgi:DNA transformation protein
MGIAWWQGAFSIYSRGNAMSASREFIEYVRELLLPLGPLTDGHFFGGFAFKSGDRQFAMIMGNTLYFRVNEASRAHYEREGMAPFYYSTKKGIVQVKKFYTVPENLFDEQDALILKAREAIHAAYSV